MRVIIRQAVLVRNQVLNEGVHVDLEEDLAKDLIRAGNAVASDGGGRSAGKKAVAAGKKMVAGPAKGS